MRSLSARARIRSAAGAHGPPGGERDVLRDGERGDRGEVLVHHPDTEPAGVAGRRNGDERPADHDLAGVGPDQAHRRRA